MYVFAYGSNLHLSQMKRRCPSARPVALVALENHRLAFVGHSSRWGGAVATAFPSDGKLVAGVVYDINLADLRVLDACEGAPRVYQREPVMVRSLRTNRLIEADCYFLDRTFGVPSIEYVSIIRRGYTRWGFDGKWLKNAVRYSKRRAQRSAAERAEREARALGFATVSDAEAWLGDPHATEEDLTMREEMYLSLLQEAHAKRDRDRAQAIMAADRRKREAQATADRIKREHGARERAKPRTRRRSKAKAKSLARTEKRDSKGRRIFTSVATS